MSGTVALLGSEHASQRLDDRGSQSSPAAPRPDDERLIDLELDANIYVRWMTQT
jgi:hypothetical protein